MLRLSTGVGKLMFYPTDFIGLNQSINNTQIKDILSEKYNYVDFSWIDKKKR